jgi:hypothetical protein
VTTKDVANRDRFVKDYTGARWFLDLTHLQIRIGAIDNNKRQR